MFDRPIRSFQGSKKEKSLKNKVKQVGRMIYEILCKSNGGWDKSPSLSIIFGLSIKTQWLSGLYYADFISFYSPTQLCGGGTTKSNSNELPISVPLSFYFINISHFFSIITITNDESVHIVSPWTLKWRVSSCSYNRQSPIFLEKERGIWSSF